MGNKRFRKTVGALLPVFLCILLTLSVAGCGNKPSAVTDPSGGNELAEIEVQTDTAEPEQEEPPELQEITLTQETDEPPEQQETGGPDVSQAQVPEIDENGSYTTKEDVALYLHVYGKLPPNFITKKEAQKLGWTGGSLEPYAPGKCIGGDHYGNYEGLLPKGNYHECDIGTLGKKKRGSKRIIYSDDGRIYYTGDHYKTFELLYGEE